MALADLTKQLAQQALLSATSPAKQPAGRDAQPVQEFGSWTAELHRITGADPTRIDGVDVVTTQVIRTELGSDLSALPDEGALCSWLELAPRRDITGGKVIKQKSRASKNRVASALRRQRGTGPRGWEWGIWRQGEGRHVVRLRWEQPPGGPIQIVWS